MPKRPIEDIIKRYMRRVVKKEGDKVNVNWVSVQNLQKMDPSGHSKEYGVAMEYLVSIGVLTKEKGYGAFMLHSVPLPGVPQHDFAKKEYAEEFTKMIHPDLNKRDVRYSKE